MTGSRPAGDPTAGELAQRIGLGVQLFRIRHPERFFEQVADLGPMFEESIGRRRVWRPRETPFFYPLLTIPYKTEEEILVRAHDGGWQSWDWRRLAETADGCRWRGPDQDARWIG